MLFIYLFRNAVQSSGINADVTDSSLHRKTMLYIMLYEKYASLHRPPLVQRRSSSINPRL